MRRPAAVLLTALLVALAAAAPARAFEVGMGDQKAGVFADPRFQALGLKPARLVVPWDAVIRGGLDVERADAWLGAAQARGHEPHVAVGHSRVEPVTVPSRQEYRVGFDLLRARYPWVRLYTPWNEANHPSQATARHPGAVAGYYEEVRAGCPGCTVLAADVIDNRGFVAWVGEFRRALDHEPRLWGLHNYSEANRPERAGATAAYLAAVPGEVWLTETGGIVRLVAASGRVSWAYDPARAAESVRRAFRAAGTNPRVTRMYLYQWSVEAHEGWDSAFVGPGGEERPALAVLRQELAALDGGHLPDSARATRVGPAARASASPTRSPP